MEKPEQQAATPDGRSATQLLFVYGTLQRGHGNHVWLAEAERLGSSSVEGLELYDLGPFPMAITGAGRVSGELYAVSEALLERLDHFEGVPRLYRRERRTLGDGREAWIYLGRPRQVRHSPRLEQGCWPGAGGRRAIPTRAAEPTAPGAAPALVGQRSGSGWPRAAANQARGPASAHLASAPLQTRSGRGLFRITAPLLVTLLGGVALLRPAPARADASLALCQRWRSSSGQERILLGNAIGAASYLTKVHKLAESPPEAPVDLYATSDLMRVCDGWR